MFIFRMQIAPNIDKSIGVYDRLRGLENGFEGSRLSLCISSSLVPILPGITKIYCCGNVRAGVLAMDYYLMRTELSGSDIEIACPYDRFLFVQVVNIILEMNIPFFLRIQSLVWERSRLSCPIITNDRIPHLQIGTCIHDVGADNVAAFKFECNNPPLD